MPRSYFGWSWSGTVSQASAVSTGSGGSSCARSAGGVDRRDRPGRARAPAGRRRRAWCPTGRARSSTPASRSVGDQLLHAREQARQALLGAPAGVPQSQTSHSISAVLPGCPLDLLSRRAATRDTPPCSPSHLPAQGQGQSLGSCGVAVASGDGTAMSFAAGLRHPWPATSGLSRQADDHDLRCRVTASSPPAADVDSRPHLMPSAAVRCGSARRRPPSPAVGRRPAP